MPKEKVKQGGKTKQKTVAKKVTTRKKRKDTGLKVDRLFTSPKTNSLDEVSYEPRSCKIINPDGSVVFEMKNIEVPKSWSRVASDILISKYVRKKGVPQLDRFGSLIKDKYGKTKLGAERSAKQVVSRIASCWRM